MSMLRVGDWVEVRSKQEILATLDGNGRLDGLPLMPQMLQYCGQKFQVWKSAHKTCDTVTGAYVNRWLDGGVHLNLRCDGKAYGGCQAGCLIYWKSAWLKPVDIGAADGAEAPSAGQVSSATSAKEEAMWRGTLNNQASGEETVYSCQATELMTFTRPLPWYDARQYVEDYRTGNVELRQMLASFAHMTYYYCSLSFRGRLGEPGRWLYDRFQSLWGGLPYPRRRGLWPDGPPTPTVELNLQPGELVRVRPYSEILKTIDKRKYNRGLGFDVELVPYCGKTFKVRTRVETFVDERTGRLRKMKTPAVILEDVYCKARYSTCRLHCPRSIYSWWREIWLERV